MYFMMQSSRTDQSSPGDSLTKDCLVLIPEFQINIDVNRLFRSVVSFCLCVKFWHTDKFCKICWSNGQKNQTNIQTNKQKCWYSLFQMFLLQSLPPAEKTDAGIRFSVIVPKVTAEAVNENGKYITLRRNPFQYIHRFGVIHSHNSKVTD